MGVTYPVAGIGDRHGRPGFVPESSPDSRRRFGKVREGKGDNDRLSLLPQAVTSDPDRVRRLHQRDLQRDAGWIDLPGAREPKYPNAGREWPWQWVFPAPPHPPPPGKWGTAPLPRDGNPERDQGRRAARPHRQTRDLPHLPPGRCHPPPGRQLRRPHRAGVPPPQGGGDQPDLHHVLDRAAGSVNHPADGLLVG